MKILIINPNSDSEMTAQIQETAVAFAAGAYEVECRRNPDAPPFIETYEDQVRTAPGMIALVRENEDSCDAFIVACHCDPNLDVLREITDKPVIGIGQTSMQMAAMLGHRFSVVSTTDHSIPNTEALVRKYHLAGQLASVRAPSPGMEHAPDEEKYLDAARRAISEDSAEVIVLGCAGMTGLDKRLQEQLGAPVLDGVICALILASGLLFWGRTMESSCKQST
jgi:allantoin racemase